MREFGGAQGHSSLHCGAGRDGQGGRLGWVGYWVLPRNLLQVAQEAADCTASSHESRDAIQGRQAALAAFHHSLATDKYRPPQALSTTPTSGVRVLPSGGNFGKLVKREEGRWFSLPLPLAVPP